MSSLTQARKAWNDEDKQISRAVRMICVGADMNHEQFAKAIGITKATLYRKLKNPQSFTLSELRSIKFVAQNKKIDIGLGVEI